MKENSFTSSSAKVTANETITNKQTINNNKNQTKGQQIRVSTRKQHKQQQINETDRQTLKDSTASSSSSINKTPKSTNKTKNNRFKCLTDIKKVIKKKLLTNTSIKDNNSSKPYNTRHNPKKSNKALLLSLNETDTKTVKHNLLKQPNIRRKLDFMDKNDDNQASLSLPSTTTDCDNDKNGQEGQSSDSGRSTPSKHHPDGASIPPGTSGSSRPVAPLSLRRQIALALELSKDTNKTSSEVTSEISGQEAPIKSVKNKQILPQHRNNKGETELHLAAIRNDYVKIEQILKQHTDEHGDILIDVNVKDFAGWTPLHEACIKGHTQTVRVLVTHGANVNVISEDGTTPLIDASTHGHLSIVKLLLKHGANPLVLNKKGQNSIDSAASPTIENLLRSYIKTDKIIENKKSDDKNKDEFNIIESNEIDKEINIKKAHDKVKIEDNHRKKQEINELDDKKDRKKENRTKIEDKIDLKDKKDKVKESEKINKDFKEEKKLDSKINQKVHNKKDNTIDNNSDPSSSTNESSDNYSQLSSHVKVSSNTNSSLPSTFDSQNLFSTSQTVINEHLSTLISTIDKNPNSVVDSDCSSLISSSSTAENNSSSVLTTIIKIKTEISNDSEAIVNSSEVEQKMSSNNEKMSVSSSSGITSLTTITATTNISTTTTATSSIPSSSIVKQPSHTVSSQSEVAANNYSVSIPANNKNIVSNLPSSTSVDPKITETSTITVHSLHPSVSLSDNTSFSSNTVNSSNFNSDSGLNSTTMSLQTPVSMTYTQSSVNSSHNFSSGLPSTRNNVTSLPGNETFSVSQMPYNSMNLPSTSFSNTSSSITTSSNVKPSSLPSSFSTISSPSSTTTLSSTSNPVTQNVSFTSTLPVTVSSPATSISQSVTLSSANTTNSVSSSQISTTTATAIITASSAPTSQITTTNSLSSASSGAVTVSSNSSVGKIQETTDETASQSSDKAEHQVNDIVKENKADKESHKSDTQASSPNNEALMRDLSDDKNKNDHGPGNSSGLTNVTISTINSNATNIQVSTTSSNTNRYSEISAGNASNANNTSTTASATTAGTTTTTTSSTGHHLRGRKRRREEQSTSGNDKSEGGSNKKSKEHRNQSNAANTIQSNDGGHTTEDEAVSDCGSGHLSEAPLKVPPLRIVLNTHDQSREGSSNNATFRQYVINPDAGSDDAQDSVVPSSGANSAGTGNASGTQAGLNSTPSTRITRSSHRVALQQQKDSDLVDHGSSTGIGTRKKNKNRASRSNLENERSTITANLANNAGNYSQSNSPLPTDKQNNNLVNSAHENDENSSSSTTSTIHDLSMNPNLYNYKPENASTKMFLSIREHVDKRRRAMERIAPQKYPDCFDDYLTMKRSYMLQNNVEKMQIETMHPPPSNLSPSSPLYHLFQEQERERHRMRLRHQVEREKMRMTAEQEYYRVHCRAAHANAGQNIPLSVATFLKDEELNNLLEFESDNGQDNIIVTQLRADDQNFLNHGPSGMNASARIKCNGRVLLKWKSDVEDKWNNSKINLINRQKMEAEALASTQRLNWQWKLNEIAEASGSPQTNFSIISFNEHEDFVPMIKVYDEFNLFPV